MITNKPVRQRRVTNDVWTGIISGLEVMNRDNENWKWAHQLTRDPNFEFHWRAA